MAALWSAILCTRILIELMNKICNQQGYEHEHISSSLARRKSKKYCLFLIHLDYECESVHKLMKLINNFCSFLGEEVVSWLFLMLEFMRNLSFILQGHAMTFCNFFFNGSRLFFKIISLMFVALCWLVIFFGRMKRARMGKIIKSTVHWTCTAEIGSV